MAGPVLPVAVGVANKLLRAEQPLAFETLDAASCRRCVRFRQHNSVAGSEAGVVHPEGEGRGLGVEAAHGRQRRGPVEQNTAKTLSVTLGDESAL